MLTIVCIVANAWFVNSFPCQYGFAIMTDIGGMYLHVRFPGKVMNCLRFLCQDGDFIVSYDFSFIWRSLVGQFQYLCTSQGSLDVPSNYLVCNTASYIDVVLKSVSLTWLLTSTLVPGLLSLGVKLTSSVDLLLPYIAEEVKEITTEAFIKVPSIHWNVAIASLFYVIKTCGMSSVVTARGMSK